MSKLKPCPFCGGKADAKGWASLNDIDDDSYSSGPECEECGATSPDIESWNRRAILEGMQLVEISYLQKLKNDLLIRSELDTNGVTKVVNLSDGLWCKLCDLVKADNQKEGEL